MTVRTRFAPSPTGYMHIGGMRTALFNWLWARRNGGQFILRIDDTDRQRNMEEALEPILQAFRWLGLDWDEGPDVGGPHGPYFQSQRGHLYASAVEELLTQGKAFRDFDPPEVTKADREAAEKEKRPRLNVRRSLDLTPDQIQQNLDEGKPYVVRFLVPRGRTISVDDSVRGHVEWDCGQIPDPVILRGNGTPLYNFATVIDDAQLEITHVIRAAEHLSNTAPQLLMYEALGLTPPEFAHIPAVNAPGGSKKLSKRDIKKYRNNPQFKKMFDVGDRVLPAIGLEVSDELSPVMVAYYQSVGYLPHGVINALARLGWSLDGETELMTRETIQEQFSLDRVIKAPAGLDPDKLMSYQEYWMNELSLDDRINGCLPYLTQAGLIDAVPGDELRAFIGRLITALGDRLKLFSDILEHRDFFTADNELPYDEKAFEKRLTKPEDAADLLRAFRDQLAVVEPFDAATTDALLHDFVEQKDVKIGQIIHALRVATTGKAKGPGMFDCLELLGRERCLDRIDRALRRISGA